MNDKTDFISTVANKLQDLVEQGQPLRDDFEKNVRAILASTFNKMDLVTRDEFEAQAAVLQRTRMMVEELEKRVTGLELSILADNDEPSDKGDTAS